MEIKNVKLGAAQVNKIYVGDNMTWQYEAPDVTAPVTNIYPSSGTHYAGDQVWFEVNEACITYYTLDGSTPTTGSTKYIEPITINATTTIKYFSVDLAGNVETYKTTVFDITPPMPVSTISPSAATQNNIPVTVSLSATNATTIYYKIGAMGQTTYTAPFQVTQNTAGVGSVNIPITYWSEGAGGTEAQRTMTYNTAGADPVAPVVTVTNGKNQVILDWAATQNSLSYTIYRSTVQGSQGSILAGTQYMTGLTWTDTTVTGGTTYYYTVVAGNFGLTTPSAQVTANPTAPLSWRYLKINGYGTSTDTTTRIIEFEAWEGATNRMAAATFPAYDAISTGSTDINTIKDGVKTIATNSYPIWWSAIPNTHLVIDLGAQYALTKLSYYSYSKAGDQRQNRFRVYGSNTNNGADWMSLWDMSANTTPQPILPDGYELVL